MALPDQFKLNGKTALVTGGSVTRDIPSLIKAGGFKIEQLDEACLALFPESGSYFDWGVARPQV